MVELRWWLGFGD
jgi:hypothetical protein